jgi:hypothetical protein
MRARAERGDAERAKEASGGSALMVLCAEKKQSTGSGLLVLPPSVTNLWTTPSLPGPRHPSQTPGCLDTRMSCLCRYHNTIDRECAIGRRWSGWDA